MKKKQNMRSNLLLGNLFIGYYDALAKLVELLRRAGKLDEGQKYLDQVKK